MARALDELVIRGVETCVPFQRRVMDEGDFQAGDLSIRYLEEHPGLMGGQEEEALLSAAAVTAALLAEGERGSLRAGSAGVSPEGGFSSWKRAGWPFRNRR